MAEKARRELPSPREDAVANLAIIASPEGRRARKKHVRNDAERPEVTLCRVRAAQHLRRDIIHRSDGTDDVLVRSEVLRQPKIDQFERGPLPKCSWARGLRASRAVRCRRRSSVMARRLLKEPVLEFEITVHNPLRVHVLDRREHLHEEARCVCLGAVLTGRVHELEKLPAGA